MAFWDQKLPARFQPLLSTMSVPPELLQVAQAFVELQQIRHEADYNIGKNFSRADSIQYVTQAEDAFEAWNAIRKHAIAKLYLGSFSQWKEWNKPGR